MNSKVLILLALFALGKADEGCGEERGQSCMDNFLAAILSSSSDEDVCRELREVTECLRSAAEDCLSEEKRREVEGAIKELEDTLGDECPIEYEYDDDTDAEVCLEENKDYIMQCMGQGTVEALRLLGNRNEDANLVKCTVYSLISECALERTLEKCGERIRDLLREELSNPPRQIKQACEASAGRHVTQVISLLEKRRK